jgi:hypothetical protein
LAIYPAIDVRSGPADVIPAIVDDFRPMAIEERADSIRIFFIDTYLRDAARRSSLRRQIQCSAR